MTVEESAAALGFESPRALYRIFSGQYLPSTEHLIGIAGLTGVPVERLIALRKNQDETGRTDKKLDKQGKNKENKENRENRENCTLRSRTEKNHSTAAQKGMAITGCGLSFIFVSSPAERKTGWQLRIVLAAMLYYRFLLTAGK